MSKSIGESDTVAPPSWPSRLLLWWLWPFILKGYKSPLKPKDMPKLRSDIKTTSICPEALRIWDSSKTPSLLKVSWAMHKREVTLSCIFGNTQGLLNNMGKPILLKVLIEAFDTNTDKNDMHILLLIFVFGLVILLEGWCKLNSVNLVATDVGNGFASWLLTLTQRKSTRITAAVWKGRGKKKKDVEHGEEKEEHANEATLIGNDLLQNLDMLKWMSYFPLCVTGLISGSVTLLLLLGLPAVIGLATMAVTLFFNRLCSSLGRAVTKRDLEAADARLNVLKEILHNIAPVKFLGWEAPYLETLSDKRAKELKEILKYRMLLVVSITSGRVSPVLASCATFTFMGMRGYALNAAVIFSALAAFNALRMPLITLPLNLTQFAALSVSLRRIESYLNKEERELLMQPNDTDVLLEFKNAKISWPKEEKRFGEISENVEEGSPKTFYVKNVSFQVKRGELIGIVGRVGSGKTTLLSAISGISKVVHGSLQGPNRAGLCPQKPFVLSGTVRDNIRMGRYQNSNCQKSALDSAVHSAAMERDIATFPAGLDAALGEEGTTLSGGQQMRLNIARAVYGDPELLLLDDALAAVDGMVASQIFERVCLARKKRGLATIIVLNQLQFLDRQFDKIIYLKKAERESEINVNVNLENEKNNIKKIDMTSYMSACGTYETLLKGNQDFADMIASTSVHSAVDDLKLSSERVKAFTDCTRTDGIHYIEEKMEGGDDSISSSSNAQNFSAASKRASALLVKEQQKGKGAIQEPLKIYFKSLGGYFHLFGAVLLAVTAYSIMGMTDLWLAAWISSDNTTSTFERCVGYTILSLGQAIFIMLLSFFNAYSANRASASIHSQCAERLCHAPSSFFESTPSGRVLSRFSGDLSTVDHFFSYVYDDAFQFAFLLLCLFSVIIILVPEMVTLMVPNLVIYYYAVIAVDRTNRECKRESNNALSPLMTCVSETAAARALIHSMNLGNFFRKRQGGNIDTWVRYNHFSGSVVQFGVLSSSFIGFVLSVGATLFVFVRRDAYKETATIGLVLNYSIIFPYFLSLFSLILMLLLNGATCVERILQYVNVPQEAAWYLPDDPKKNEWPKTGSLSFQNVSMRYRSNLPLAIKGVSFEIRHGEKVGVVGRTGAGKSSLIAILFRILEVSGGRILYDNIDISKLGLRRLRGALKIITQTPLILPGSVSHNLDPFHCTNEAEQSLCLYKVGLRTQQLNESASSLSAGERQLLSLARLLLNQNLSPHIVIMDEPTANVDATTDANVQSVIQREFEGSTLITIAHRLETVIQSDKIMVLDSGKISEFGPPWELLKNKKGSFSQMVAASDSSSSLRKLALNAQEGRK
eukprot:g3806.t1